MAYCRRQDSRTNKGIEEGHQPASQAHKQRPFLSRRTLRPRSFMGQVLPLGREPEESQPGKKLARALAKASACGNHANMARGNGMFFASKVEMLKKEKGMIREDQKKIGIVKNELDF